MAGPYVDSEAADVFHVSESDAIHRFSAVQQVHYDLFLRLNEGESFSGKCGITFQCTDQSSPIWLDFSAGEIQVFILNGKVEVPIWQRGKLLLPDLYLGMNTVEVQFLNVYRRDGTGLYRVMDIADGEQYVFSQFQADFAHTTFPCFDQPDLKATFELTVAAPNTWKVVGNEPEEKKSIFHEENVLGNTGDEFLLHTFRRTSRISTYVFAVCAGPFTEVRRDQNSAGVSLGLFTRKSMAHMLDANTYFRWTISGLLYYQNFFGVPYPFSKLDEIFISEGRFLAMENVGCITLTESYLYIGPGLKTELVRVCNTVLHEIAHMWFGNLVTMKWWEDLWLNESFATYISHVCESEALLQEFPFTWNLFLTAKEWGYEADVRSTTHPISVYVNDTGEVDTNFDGISYNKGSGVLKQLSFVIGKDVFRAALRDYVSSNQYGNTRFQDLVSVIDEHVKAAGVEIDIGVWAEMWIKTSGLNSVQAEWEAEDGQLSSFSILQGAVLSAHPTLRLHKLRVEMYDVDMKLMYAAPLIVLPQAVSVYPELTGFPVPACVILNAEDEDYVKVILDEASLSFLTLHLSKVPSLVTRQVVIKAFWDMVIDMRKSGAEFIDRFIPYLCAETSFTLCEYVLGLFVKVSQFALPRGMFDRTYSSRVFQTCFKLLKTSLDPVLKKLFLSKMFSFLKHPQDIMIAVDWLTKGVPTSPPIMLNQIGRWIILCAYASISPLAITDVEREFKCDQSVQGKYYKLQCDASYPVPGLKTKAWEDLIGNAGQFTAVEVAYYAAGFNNPSQFWLFHPYYFRFSAGMKEVYDVAEARVVKNLNSGLIPAYSDESSTISLLEKHLSSVPVDLVRDVTEALDDCRKEQRTRKLSTDYFYRATRDFTD